MLFTSSHARTIQCGSEKVDKVLPQPQFFFLLFFSLCCVCLGVSKLEIDIVTNNKMQLKKSLSLKKKKKKKNVNGCADDSPSNAKVMCMIPRKCMNW